MTMVSEYGAIDKNAPWSKEIKIAEAPSNTYAPRMIRLVEITEGWTIAGSMARWQEQRFGVRFNEDGRLFGRQFSTREDAEKAFRSWTVQKS